MHDLNQGCRPPRSRQTKTVEIVVLSNSDFDLQKYSSNQWVYQDFFWIKGSAMSQRDLIMAGIYTADSIVVLGDPFSPGQGHSKRWNDEYMVDADAITVLRNLIEMRSEDPKGKQPNFIVELQKSTNIKFISSQPLRHGTARTGFGQAVPLQGGGRRHSTGGRSFSPHAIETTQAPSDVPYYLQPVFACGLVYFGNFVDSLLSEMQKKIHIYQILQLLISGSSFIATLGGEEEGVGVPDDARLYEVPLPKDLMGMAFGKIFTKLMERYDILSVAILRSGKRPKSSQRYVYSNPDSASSVFKGDSLLVLGTASNLSRLWATTKKTPSICEAEAPTASHNV
jgi:hypothetical protein